MSKLTLVVCEDDPLIRMNLVAMLEEIGHAAIEAADGATALSVLQTVGADVLIADLGLPDMPGEQLAQRARDVRPDLPIIYATGRSNIDETVDPARVRVLLKPYSLAALETAIHELVQPNGQASASM